MSAAVSTAAMDVVLYQVIYTDTGTEVPSVSRGDQAEVERFIASPTWPYKRTDSFVGVNEWGYGEITAATIDLQTWVGKSFAEFKRAAH